MEMPGNRRRGQPKELISECGHGVRLAREADGEELFLSVVSLDDDYNFVGIAVGFTSFTYFPHSATIFSVYLVRLPLNI